MSVLVAEQGPAVDYGCPIHPAGQPRHVCGSRNCFPNPTPCSEFMGSADSDPEFRYWCPCCGWAEWAHPAEAS